MQHFNLILIEKTPNKFILIVHYSGRERSGSVVECLTQDQRVPRKSLNGVTALWSLSKTHLS